MNDVVLFNGLKNGKSTRYFAKETCAGYILNKYCEDTITYCGIFDTKEEANQFIEKDD